MTLNKLANKVHEANQKWWHDIHTGEPLFRNRAEMLALVHSEISEYHDAGTLQYDDKITHRFMREVELADTVIRLLDYARGLGYDLDSASDEYGIRFESLNDIPFNVPSGSWLLEYGVTTADLHSSISAILEAERKTRTASVPSLILRAIVKIIDAATERGFDIQGAFDDKMAFNAIREDHTHEARLLPDGKKI